LPVTEARVAEIEKELTRLEAVPALARVDLTKFEREIEEQLGRFEELLKGNVPRARQALKKLLAKEVTFTPIQLENGKRSFEFRGELSYGAILREVVSMHKIPLGIRTRGCQPLWNVPGIWH